MKYDLVFEGGGAKGMVFVGACEEFFGREHTFGRLLGTSAGAITATLLAAGYGPAEMRAALAEKSGDVSVFSTFMGPPKAFTGEEIDAGDLMGLLAKVDIPRMNGMFESIVERTLVTALAAAESTRSLVALIERGGWYCADAFVVWLSQKLDSPYPSGRSRKFSQLTLSEFYSRTNVDLSLVASDTNDGKLLVLNHRTAPSCPVVWAVRMSLSIPFLWEEVIWQSNWGQYRGADISGNAIVDGGVLSNFPIELFISDELPITSVMGPKERSAVIGLLIDESLHVPQVSAMNFEDVRAALSELRLVQQLKRLVDTMTSARDKMVVAEYEHLVARLPAEGYGTTEFDMSENRRESLVLAGRNAMAAYLDGVKSTTAANSERMSIQSSAADQIASKILSAHPPTFN